MDNIPRSRPVSHSDNTERSENIPKQTGKRGGKIIEHIRASSPQATFKKDIENYKQDPSGFKKEQGRDYANFIKEMAKADKQPKKSLYQRASSNINKLKIFIYNKILTKKEVFKETEAMRPMHDILKNMLTEDMNKESVMHKDVNLDNNFAKDIGRCYLKIGDTIDLGVGPEVKDKIKEIPEILNTYLETLEGDQSKNEKLLMDAIKVTNQISLLIVLAAAGSTPDIPKLSYEPGGESHPAYELSIKDGVCNFKFSDIRKNLDIATCTDGDNGPESINAKDNTKFKNSYLTKGEVNISYNKEGKIQVELLELKREISFEGRFQSITYKEKNEAIS